MSGFVCAWRVRTHIISTTCRRDSASLVPTPIAFKFSSLVLVLLIF